MVTAENLAVLIATRNRPQNLVKTLKSIATSETLPAYVIVVSSGSNVSKSIDSVTWPFHLIYEHISEYGQIRQKQLGITFIPEICQWVLFLDDDVLLQADAISNAFSFLQKSAETILGVGFGYTSEREKLDWKSALNSRRPGKVTSDGRNLGYGNAQGVVSTEWLNGISLWSKTALSKYQFSYLNSKYSICEDLIFSYAVSRIGKIVYAPFCKFNFQNDERKLVTSFEAFRANAYWRLFFVLTNSNLSKLKYLLFQFYRTFMFLLNKQNNEGRGKEVLLIYLDLIRICLTRVDPTTMLESRRV